MPITHAEFLEMERRTMANRKRFFSDVKTAVAVDRERDLHEQICTHCDSQWPRWKYIHARMDQRSTIEEGAQDFTIFLPGSRILCIECKAKGKKQDDKQRVWAFEMERLGHTVHCIRSIEEFHRIANQVTKPPHDTATDAGIPPLRHVRD